MKKCGKKYCNPFRILIGNTLLSADTLKFPELQPLQN